MSSDEILRHLLARVLRAAGSAGDDEEGQREMRAAARLLGERLAVLGVDGATDVADPAVDETHARLDAEWQSYGMPSVVPWATIWTPWIVMDDGRPVALFYLRRDRQPSVPAMPYGTTVPFAQVRAAAGHGFSVLGAVLPGPVVPGCWTLHPTDDDPLWLAPVATRVWAPDGAAAWKIVVPNGATEGAHPHDLDTRRRTALKRILAFSLTGRPDGSGRYRDGAQLRADIDPIVRELRAAGVYPSREAVAARMPVDERTGDEVDPKLLGKWVRRRLRLTWPQYLARIP